MTSCISIMEKSPGETKAEHSITSVTALWLCFRTLKLSYGALHLFAFLRQYCASLELYGILPLLYCPLKSAAFKLRCDLCNVLSFTISPSPRGEQSHMTDTVMMLVCICSTQAAVVWLCLPLSQTRAHTHTALWCDSLSLSLTHTHTHTHTHNVQNSQSLIQKHQIVIAKSELPPLLGSRNCHP